MGIDAVSSVICGQAGISFVTSLMWKAPPDPPKNTHVFLWGAWGHVKWGMWALCYAMGVYRIV